MAYAAAVGRRRRMGTALLVTMTALALLGPASGAEGEPPMCRPSPGRHNGCIPTPLDCATGRFNGEWAAPHDGRRASCDGFLDEAGGWHVRRYTGGDPAVGCETTIRDDKLIEGSWTQFHRHAMKITRRLRGQFLERLHQFPETVGTWVGIEQRFEAEIQGSQVLSQLIV